MKHIITWIVPDCPHCGKELRRVGRHKPNSFSRKNKFGTWQYHYECGCGYETEWIDGRGDEEKVEVTEPVA